MKKLIMATLVAATTLGAGLTLVSTAHAATDEQKAAAKQKWESMTPEEKAAAKEQAKAKWDSMTPEEQAAAKKKHPRAAKMAEKKKEEAAATPTK